MKYSQFGQDLYIKNTFFNNINNGFFVDIGANNGVTGSNTKLFEDCGWDGICIEPNPDIFKELIKNRKCKCIEAAISNSSTDYVEFCKIDGYAEMLSGIIDSYDEKHKQRILTEQNLYGGSRKKIKVKNYKFCDIIHNSNIDYLSIDTEGSEFEIINSIDFKKYNISVISIENNYNDSKIKNFLQSNNFKNITNLDVDEIYINNNLSG